MAWCADEDEVTLMVNDNQEGESFVLFERMQWRFKAAACWLREGRL